MRVLHLINNSGIPKARRPYYKHLLNHQKELNLKISTVRFLIIPRYVIQRLLWGRYQLIHVHQPTKLMMTVMLIFRFVDHTPLCVTFYNESLTLKRRFFKSLISRLSLSFVIKAKAVFFADRETYNLYKRKYKSLSSKFFLIEEGCIIPDGAHDSYQLKISHNFIISQDSSNRFDMTFLLLEAFSQLPRNYKLHLIGDYGEYLEDIVASAKNLGISSSVEFLFSPDFDIYVDINKSGEIAPILSALTSGKCVIGLRDDINIDGYYCINGLSQKKMAKLLYSVQYSPNNIDFKALSRIYSWNARANQYKTIYDYILHNR